jgi:hypothetical protein
MPLRLIRWWLDSSAELQDTMRFVVWAASCTLEVRQCNQGIQFAWWLIKDYQSDSTLRLPANCCVISYAGPGMSCVVFWGSVC